MFAIIILVLDLYLLAIAVADVSTTLRTVLYFSVPVRHFILVTVPREHSSTRSEADDFT